MAKVYAIDGIVPVVDPSAFVHPTAVLIGDVIVGPRCYVGPLASLRGDFGRLMLGEGANIQDTCVMHGFPEHRHGGRGEWSYRPRRGAPRLPHRAQRAGRHERGRHGRGGDRREQHRRRHGFRQSQNDHPAQKPGRRAFPRESSAR